MLPIEMTSFSFAAIQQAIKNPARGVANEYVVGRSIATHTPPAFPIRVLYCSQPSAHSFRLPDRLMYSDHADLRRIINSQE